MFPDELAPDRDAVARDRMQTELRDSLTVISVRMQLLQRQVLRADGLSELDRETLLLGLEAALRESRQVTARMEALIGGDHPHAASPSPPVRFPQETPC